MGRAPHQVQPRGVDLQAVKTHLAPGPAVGRAAAIGAGGLLSEDHHFGLWNLRHQPWQGAGQDVQPPQRLHIVVDMGDQRRSDRDDPAIGKLERLRRAGADRLDIDAFVNDPHARLEDGGQGVGLKGGGRDDDVRVGERQRHHRVLGLAQKHRLFGGREEFGVEADIEAAPAIEEFREHHPPGVRKHIVEEDGFAPAGVGDDHRRIDATILQRARHLQRRAPAEQVRLGPHREREHARGGATRQAVAADAHPLDPWRGLRADRRAGHATRHEGLRQIPELGREVVVHEEDAGGHGGVLPARGAAVTCRGAEKLGGGRHPG